MHFTFILCLVLFTPLISAIEWNLNHYFTTDPDEHRSVLDLISTKGYPAEEHHVKTDDGYILTMHRIRGGRYESRDNQTKPVVFLQHGLLDSSATWVVNEADQSLGFILADAGFDVWMGNMRGNTYGMGHIKLKPNMKEFWNFSWDEMAAHDLPSMIDFTLQHTQQEKLFYVGHSQGTMTLFAALSSNKTLASKIKLFCALGPVATVKTIVSPIKYFSYLGRFPDYSLLYDLFGSKDFLPSNLIIKWIADKVCNNLYTTPMICDNIIFLFAGPSDNLNNSRIAVYTNNAPAGTSVKNLVHYAQSVVTGNFQMYDYGSKNIEKYNQTTAPLYNLTKVNVPVALYWADKDWLADPTDVNFLRKYLPNVIDDYECEDWNHLDFLWAVNTNDLLYKRMIGLMLKHL